MYIKNSKSFFISKGEFAIIVGSNDMIIKYSSFPFFFISNGINGFLLFVISSNCSFKILFIKRMFYH